VVELDVEKEVAVVVEKMPPLERSSQSTAASIAAVALAG
jgi:hypothetical protein